MSNHLNLGKRLSGFTMTPQSRAGRGGNELKSFSRHTSANIMDITINTPQGKKEAEAVGSEKIRTMDNRKEGSIARVS